jgi:GntR family transcriptional regulator, rspAB operon transcriptional repressor
MNITERFARETARDYALRMLKRNIASMELKPGTMLSENELSIALGLSRTPVREALIELSKVRIVEILPRRGSRIALIDYDFVEESRFMRMVFEKAIFELACGMAAELNFSAVVANVKLQQFYFENQLNEKLMELDDAFHREFFHLTNKMQCYHMLESMTLHFDRVRNLSLFAVKEIKIVEDHQRLLAAVQAGDKEQASALIVKRLSRYKVDKEEIYSNYHEYFTE